MIRCRLRHLEQRCRERGYTLEEVQACIVSRTGDIIVVDETHQAYPRATGPGTELKKLLSLVGFHSTPGCRCNQRARAMDQRGCDWCEQNIETICDWLKEEADARGLLFLRSAAKLVVRRAIHNARAVASKESDNG